MSCGKKDYHEIFCLNPMSKSLGPPILTLPPDIAYFPSNQNVSQNVCSNFILLHLLAEIYTQTRIPETFGTYTWKTYQWSVCDIDLLRNDH